MLSQVMHWVLSSCLSPDIFKMRFILLAACILGVVLCAPVRKTFLLHITVINWLILDKVFLPQCSCSFPSFKRLKDPLFWVFSGPLVISINKILFQFKITDSEVFFFFFFTEWQVHGVRYPLCSSAGTVALTAQQHALKQHALKTTVKDTFSWWTSSAHRSAIMSPPLMLTSPQLRPVVAVSLLLKCMWTSQAAQAIPAGAPVESLDVVRDTYSFISTPFLWISCIIYSFKW